VKKSNLTSALLISGMLFTVVLSHLPVLYTAFYHELTGANRAKDGVMNLNYASMDKNIVLDGEWEFYWNRLLVTKMEQNAKPDFSIQVPDYWTKYKINNEYLPAEGFASYRLVLNGSRFDSFPVTICLPDFGSAYRVFVDSILVAESGVMTDRIEDIFTTTKSTLYPVTLSEEGEHEVIIEVATRRFSGLYMAPVLQNYQTAVLRNTERNNLRLILFGTALFPFFILIGVYTLSFYKNKSSVWLPVIGLFVLLRIMMTTEFFSFWQDKLFFHLSYEATNPLMFFVTFAFKYMLIFLIEELMNIYFSKKEKVLLLVYYVILYLVYLFIPNGFYNRYLTILLPVCAFLIEFYAFFKVYRNRSKLNSYALWIYWGMVLSITGLIIDCYYINGNIYLNMSLVLLIMFTVYIMIISLVSAVRTAEVYRDYALSASQLEQSRAQIEMQKEYYRSLCHQINEVRSIRHDVRHFIRVIERLVKEKHYEKLEQFLSEYVVKADSKPFPVFCENIVINSILGYFALRFQESGIPFHCVCAVPQQIYVSDSDLCVVLSNSLENAMEACKRMEDIDKCFVDAELKYLNNHLLIKISNSFNGELNEKDSSFLTTKKERYHGFGLKNIEKVADLYGGYLKIEHSDNVFTLMIAFPDHSGSEKQASHLPG